MTPAAPGSEPGGFEYGPEIWMLGLGIIATAIVFIVFLWLIRLMIKEDRQVRLRERLEDAEERDPSEGIER